MNPNSVLLCGYAFQVNSYPAFVEPLFRDNSSNMIYVQEIDKNNQVRRLLHTEIGTNQIQSEEKNPPPEIVAEVNAEAIFSFAFTAKEIFVGKKIRASK